jgi:excisionase family DNA binding protein
MHSADAIARRFSRRSRLPRGQRRCPHRGAGVAARSRPGEQIGGDPLLTADEVAAMLRVSKAWVYAETRKKRIPHVPLGRYVRYRRSAVIEWIAALERQSSSGLRVPIGED